MPVIVDAMGGDFAPSEVVQGALLAADQFDIDILLVGQREQIAPLVAGHPHLRIEHAEEVVGMHEHPARSLKRKPQSSIAVAARLAKDLPGSPLVSAGSTGAVLAAALFIWKRIPGIERPCIAGIMPTTKAPCVIADIGANVDCKPSQICQFALLAATYASHTLGIENPSVGLLNIGAEATKGNEASQVAYQALKELSGIRFLGNVEPEAIYAGEVDVVASDGFAGNIFLKTSEALAHVFHHQIEKMSAHPILAPGGQHLREKLAHFSPDLSDYAGAPLLGTNGTAIIVHGSARAETVKNAIQVAHRAAQSGYLEHLKDIYRKKQEAPHA
jgi:glycerol-3-phosphate acyltransferase PlsX